MDGHGGSGVGSSCRGPHGSRSTILIPSFSVSYVTILYFRRSLRASKGKTQRWNDPSSFHEVYLVTG